MQSFGQNQDGDVSNKAPFILLVPPMIVRVLEAKGMKSRLALIILYGT